MKGGCYLTLALLTALVLGYHALLEPTVDPPELWISSGVMGVLSWLCLGSLWNAWHMQATIRALFEALEGVPPSDGNICAVYGQLQAYEQPILSPMTGRPCVIYEFEMTRITGSGKNRQRLVDFAGIGMAPCEIATKTDTLALIGYPDLEDFNGAICPPGTRERARDYVNTGEWQDCSGWNALRGFRLMWVAITSREEAIRRNFRMVGPRTCPWLARPIETPEEQRERERRDDYHPTITEKRLGVGMFVTAIGIYRAEAHALVTEKGTTLQRLQLRHGSLEQIYQKQRQLRQSYFWGGLICLLVLHAVAFGVLQLYLRSKAAG